MTTMQAVRDDEPLTLDGLRDAIDELDRTVIAALTVRVQLADAVLRLCRGPLSIG